MGRPGIPHLFFLMDKMSTLLWKQQFKTCIFKVDRVIWGILWESTPSGPSGSTPKSRGAYESEYCCPLTIRDTPPLVESLHLIWHSLKRVHGSNKRKLWKLQGSGLSSITSDEGEMGEDADEQPIFGLSTEVQTAIANKGSYLFQPSSFGSQRGQGHEAMYPPAHSASPWCTCHLRRTVEPTLTPLWHWRCKQQLEQQRGL